MGIARDLVDRGHLVGLVARGRERLKLAADELRRSPNAKDRVCFAAFDIGVSEAVETGVEKLVGQLGGLDVLINNAAAVDTRSLPELSASELEEVLRTNIIGSALMIHTCLPMLQASARGHVVNISSINGALDPLKRGSAYTAAKFALRGLGYSLRHELAPLGIRVTTIHPGPIDSRSPRHDPKRDHSWKIPMDAVTGSILYAIGAPIEVDVSEIEIHPTATRP